MKRHLLGYARMVGGSVVIGLLTIYIWGLVDIIRHPVKWEAWSPSSWQAAFTGFVTAVVVGLVGLAVLYGAFRLIHALAWWVGGLGGGPRDDFDRLPDLPKS